MRGVNQGLGSGTGIRIQGKGIGMKMGGPHQGANALSGG